MGRNLHRTLLKWCLPALFLGVALLPAAASAQAPTYITQWGSLGSGDGQFNNPISITVDHQGNVYVGDHGNHRIQKFTSDGTYLTQWGSLGSGSGQFNGVIGVATDAAGNVYVVDDSHRIQKFTSTGSYLTEWGAYWLGDPSFAFYRAVAVDAAGVVFLSSLYPEGITSHLWKCTDTGVFLAVVRHEAPDGIALDEAGNVYAATYNRIQKLTEAGTLITEWDTPGGGLGGIAVDAEDNVYVSDVNNHRMLKFSSDGTLLAQWGSQGSGNGQFNHPYGVAVDREGNVYVADDSNHRVQKFGYVPVAAKPTTWGRLKRLYR